MDTHIKYNPIATPREVGFENTGAICYFNALLQSLMACSSMNQYMLEHENEFNKLGTAYIELLKRNLEDNDELRREKSSPILIMLFQIMKEKDLLGMGSGQQCAHESFCRFIDCLESPRIKRLFSHRYMTTTICECGYKSDITQDISFMFEIYLKDKIFIDKNSTGDDLRNYLLQQIDINEDYRCDKCKVKSDKVKKDTLRMVPEIIVITVLRTYFGDNRYPCYFPTGFSIPGKNNTSMQYALVSQIKHYGGMTVVKNKKGQSIPVRSSGHYTSTTLRKGRIRTYNDTHIAADSYKHDKETYMLFYHIV
jgi:ubiquitin C-terminal hydrolase